MAPRMGKDGFICFASSSTGGAAYTTEKPTYIDTWSIDGQNAIVDVTAFGNTSVARLPTLRGWTATASGTLDNATTELQAQHLLMMLASTSGVLTNVYLRIYENTTSYWQGRPMLTGISMNSQVGDKVGVTYNFQGSSALTYIAT